MPQPIPLPALGEAVTEAFIVDWLVPLGGDVEVGTPIVEVMTDKANVEVESTTAGRLVEQCFPPDARVGVGQTLAIIEPAEPGGTDD
jgi:pyruvate dehydrogenase E2 component (dihydrolipoamide acetyltransferase)